MGHTTFLQAPHPSRWGLSVALLTAALLLSGAADVRAQRANDDIANATPITSLPFDDSLNTTAATMAPDDPDCFGNGPTVWYTFTPTEDVPSSSMHRRARPTIRPCPCTPARPAT
jgi:hypothetical protein